MNTKPDTAGLAMNPEPDTTGLFLEIEFDPGAGERTALLRGVATIANSEHSPYFRRRAYPAQIVRMGPGSEQRYLLFAAQPLFTANDGDHWGLSFFVLALDEDGPTLSEPLDMKDAEFSWVHEIRDVDGDGNLDLVYCKGYEGEEALPVRRAATLVDRVWVHLPDSLLASPTCETNM